MKAHKRVKGYGDASRFKNVAKNNKSKINTAYFFMLKNFKKKIPEKNKRISPAMNGNSPSKPNGIEKVIKTIRENKIYIIVIFYPIDYPIVQTRFRDCI